MTDRTRRTISPPLAGLLLGLLTGIADLLVLAFSGTARAGMPVTPLTMIVVPWTWMTIGTLAGVLFAWQRLGKLRVLALAFAAPGLLLLSRAATPVKVALGISNKYVLALWLVATLAIAVPLLFVRMQPARRWGVWLIAALVSTAAVIFAAANVRIGDLLPSTKQTVGKTNDGRRNVVLVFLDTTRYDAVFGAQSAMPKLATFAKQSLSFDSAWAPAPWTIPSHSAVFTGEDPWTGQWDQVGKYYSRSAPLAKRLASRGYATSGVFSNSMLTDAAGFTAGFDELTFSRASNVCRTGIGNLAWRLYLNDAPRPPVCAWLSAAEVTSRGMKFVQRAQRPYFLALNYLDGHDPYYVPPQCRDASLPKVGRAERESVIISRPHRPAHPDAIRRVHNQYRAAMSCVDRSLEQLLAEVTRDGNTVVALVGDHGEQFGEHGLGAHGNSLYSQLTRVPLIVHAPGLAAGNVADAVAITDLYESLVRLAEPARARAALPLLDARQRRPVIASYDEVQPDGSIVGAFSVTSGDHHLIRWHDGREALYAYRHDEAEERLIDPRTMPSIAGPMRATLLKAHGDRSKRPEFNALGYMQ